MFTLVFSDRVVKEDIPFLPKTMRVRIQDAIQSKLTRDPIHFGKPLQHSLLGHRRLRVGDWRVIYRVDMDLRSVFIVAIDHRKDIYDQ